MTPLCLFAFFQLVNAHDNRLPIVGFFHSENSEPELAFRMAIERVNLDKNLLADARLIPTIEHLSYYDSFNTSKRICELTKKGVAAIVGPPSPETSGIVQSICNIMDIPHIETHWDVSLVPPGAVLNLFPDPKLLAKGIVGVVEDMDWESYTIIYETDDALIRLHELLKFHDGKFTADGHVPFTVWKLTSEPDQRPLLKEIQRTSDTRIILDCSLERILPILEQAKEVNMMGDYHTYLLTSLDAHTLDFGEFKQGPTNITTIRIVDPLRHKVQAAVYDWVFGEERHGKRLFLTPDTVKTESALIYDAVNLYTLALRGLNQSVSVSPLECARSTWQYGFSLISYMKNLEMEGMTGRIKFNQEGRRSFFNLDIAELTKNGFRKIGSWDPENGMNYTRTKGDIENELYQSISNKTFIVVSRIGPPYLRYKEGAEHLSGNDRFEGYSLDLIDEIAKELHFKYKFILAPDGEYGSFNQQTKQWNGLIKELRERRADLAICDLTITYERRSAVDFTMPFMTLGISIIYSKPSKQPPDLFSFLSPLSLDVWIYMATAYLGVSLLLFFLARCSPAEWESPHPCNPDSQTLECTLSLTNCLWFSIGSLMAQGSDVLPKALSTRVVGAMWWFFVLIMISSYTANLAAFLTMERMDATIESVEDLAKQNKIKYGVVAGGSSESFFSHSNRSLYQRMWSTMESTRPSVFAKSNDEGVERVLKGKRSYAFFMESTSIEYQIEQHCDLTQVGGLLDSKGYGIAMPVNSPYRIAISGAVLKMQESGKLLEIKNKWWKGGRNGKPPCSALSQGRGTTNELGIANVGGVFLVLIVGCGVAFFISLLEFIWNVRKVAVEERISPMSAFSLELKFALQCYGTTKPIRKKEEDVSLNQFAHLNHVS